jgi:hypothetical protein
MDVQPTTALTVAESLRFNIPFLYTAPTSRSRDSRSKLQCLDVIVLYFSNPYFYINHEQADMAYGTIFILNPT